MSEEERRRRAELIAKIACGCAVAMAFIAGLALFR